jgi:hypothetical protein
MNKRIGIAMHRPLTSNRVLLAALLAFAAAPALAADVGVSVSIGQPGFYGRIDIGSFPQPQVIYAEPVLIARPVVGVPVGRPIYLRVPPGHAKDWRKYCGKYSACNQPVYFVQDGWYQNVYARQYRERDYDDHGRERGGHPGKGHGKSKDKHRD